MDEISLKTISTQLEKIEQRLSQLESKSQILNIPKTNNSESTMPVYKSEAEVGKVNGLKTNSKISIVVDDSAVYKSSSFKDLNKVEEASSDYSWMGFLGIIFMVFAVVFFIKLTIDAGWLTPERQILLAVLTGIFLVFSPRFLSNISDKDYSSMLAAGGVAVLHMSWFGAFKIHNLISPITGLVMASVVGVLCLFLQSQHKNPLFALVSITGTYLSLIILGQGLDQGLLAGFMLVWNLSFCLAALYLNTRFVLTFAAYCAVFIVAMMGLDVKDPTTIQFYILIQLTQFLTFALATAYYSILHKSHLKSDEAKHLMILGTIVYSCIYMWVEKINPGFGAWVGVGIAVFIWFTYSVAEKIMGKILESRDSVVLTVGIIIFHSLFLDLTPDHFKPFWGLVLLGVGAFLNQKNGNLNVFQPLKIVLGLVFVWCLLLTFNDSHLNYLAFNFIYGLLAILVYLFVIKSAKTKNTIQIDVQIMKGLLFMAHAEILFGIYRLSKETAFLDALFVSILWGMYAIVILALGWNLKDRILAQSSILIILAAVLKAIFYDLSELNSIQVIICFLMTGGLLYGCGLAYRQMKSWPTM